MNYIEKPLPLLTSRMEFKLAPPSALASIATRIEFTDARLAYPNGHRCLDRANDSPPPPDAPPRTRASTNKIMKPNGEPGRPNSGGFRIEAALAQLGWAKQEIQDLTEAVRAAAHKDLDMTKSYKAQAKASLKKICDDMAKDNMWPKLQEYEGCWPVQSILKLTLKYRSEASRRDEMIEQSSRLEAALRGKTPAARRYRS
ncbi:hypothetical protein FPV67DRAFT_1677024 [Lyophyllum atratum]|nr:hypothetical protein FPV67DRAFT_1677024 [Lyophyllum atratum]